MLQIFISKKKERKNTLIRIFILLNTILHFWKIKKYNVE